MRVEPGGILWMMPAAWRNPLPGVLWQARKALPEGRLVARMNKFTLLDDATQGFGGAAPGAWVGETSRRQRLVGIPDPGGESRHLFGVGESPAEAGAEQGRSCEPSSTSNWGQRLTRQVMVKPDHYWCGGRRCKNGLHEPSCTKICTNCTCQAIMGPPRAPSYPPV
jgi:hypothetical protein